MLITLPYTHIHTSHKEQHTLSASCRDIHPLVNHSRVLALSQTHLPGLMLTLLTSHRPTHADKHVRKRLDRGRHIRLFASDLSVSLVLTIFRIEACTPVPNRHTHYLRWDNKKLPILVYLFVSPILFVFHSACLVFTSHSALCH